MAKPRLRGHAAAALAALATAPFLPAQDWQQIASSGPLGREFCTLACDPGRDRIVMFGGQALGTFLPQDTWEWNGSAWQQLNPSMPPAPRQGHAMAFDTVAGTVVLFGGLATAGIQNDTWTWNGSWQLLNPAVRPPVRYFHAMASDPRRARLVLFGGFGGTTLADTWEWDGSTWLARPTAAAPAPRYRTAMAYDAATQRVLLFGGTDMNNRFGDTWSWDGVAWTQLSPPQSPSPREGHAMVADAHRGVVLTFGTALGQEFNDTWIWNGSSWTLANGAAPPPRQGHGCTYDPRRGCVVVFSGSFVGVPRTDTWRLPIASVAAYGNGCGQPPLALAGPNGLLPLLGSTFPTTTSNVPAGATAAFGSLGLSRLNLGASPLPLDLSSFGMTGCWLWQDLVVPFLPASLGTGTASLMLSIPNQPALVGVHIYLQTAVAVPGINAAGLLTSNGLQLVLGG